MLPALGHVYLRESKQRRADGSTVSYLQLAEIEWVAERRGSETRVVYNVSGLPSPVGVTASRRRRAGRAASDQAAGFCQRCGSSPSMRLLGWLGSRSSTSRR